MARIGEILEEKSVGRGLLSLIECRQQRHIADLSRHQIDQIHQIPFAEQIQCPGVSGRADGVAFEQFATELNECRVFLPETLQRSFIPHDIDDRRLEPRTASFRLSPCPFGTDGGARAP